MIASRRRFLMGAGALLAAPAIVRVASIMPVSAPKTVGLRPWLVAAAEKIVNPPLFVPERTVLHGGRVWWLAGQNMIAVSRPLDPDLWLKRVAEEAANVDHGQRLLSDS